MEEETVNDVFSEKATITSMIKRVNAMRILLFLSRDADNEAYYLQEIANSLDMNEATAFTNLNKLLEAGLVEKTEAKGNRKNKYYTIFNQILAEKVIKKYKHWVAFCLARLVPYQQLYASQLKRDRRFTEACEEYGLTISEGINAIFGCYKIGKEHTGTDTILWRREQGYEPEKEPENATVEPEEIE
jgi:predicted transcriptional regulator